jgi:hypothetical protein
VQAPELEEKRGPHKRVVEGLQRGGTHIPKHRSHHNVHRAQQAAVVRTLQARRKKKLYQYCREGRLPLPSLPPRTKHANSQLA